MERVLFFSCFHCVRLSTSALSWRFKVIRTYDNACDGVSKIFQFKLSDGMSHISIGCVLLVRLHWAEVFGKRILKDDRGKTIWSVTLNLAHSAVGAGLLSPGKHFTPQDLSHPPSIKVHD